MAKRLLLAVSTLVVLVALIVATLAWSDSRSWQRYFAELRGAGEPLTFQEIAGKRPIPTADEATVAHVVEQAADILKTTPGPLSRGVLGVSDGPVIDFFAGIPVQSVEKTRQYIAPRRPALDKLEAIRDLTPGRFDISYDGPATDVMTRFIRTSPPISDIERLVFIDSTLRLIDGDLSGAASTISLYLKIVSPLSEEPGILAHMYYDAAAATAVRTLENVFRVGSLDEPRLHELDACFRSFLSSDSTKWALWGERALFISLIDDMRKVVGIPGVILSIATHGDQMRGTEMFGWLLDAHDAPDKLLLAARRIEAELPKLTRSQTFTEMQMISVSSFVLVHLCRIAEIQAARVALAAERHRGDTGRLPSDLAELVPRYLSWIPIDPFDGAPLKLALKDDGLIIYSVGQDGVDDGGSVEWQGRERRPRDVGFRMLKPEKRGLVLLENSPGQEP